MDKDRLALARQLFAVATELTEEAHEASVHGQSPDLDARNCLKLAQELQSLFRRLAVLAEALAVLVDSKHGQ